jgi:beta-phosphoglucomutase-like phosphatase (HAD superfamily)
VIERPALVIFDCDGVLVDSEGISNEVLARMLTAAGLSMSTEQSRRAFQGMMLADVIAQAERALGQPLPAHFSESFESARAAEFRSRLRPVAGAGAAVKRIKTAGVRVCVASQGQLSKTELTLTITGLRPLFDSSALFSAYSVRRGKPHPDLFLAAAERMNARPANCVVVEDTPSGVRAAVSAGMRALGYVADGDRRALQGAGAELIDSMHDLPARIGLP